MPLKDVTVVINIKKAAKLIAMGKPMILAKHTGEDSYTNYSEPEAVATVFGKDSIAHQLATAILNQGDTSTATLAIATYNPTATAEGAATTAAEAASKYFDEDWYFAVADTQVFEEVKEIADVLEGQGVKMFGTTTSLMADLRALNVHKYDRTFVMFHETVGEYPAEALIGGHGSKPVGSITYKDKKLVGITPQAFSNAKLTDIEALNGFSYIAKSGFNVTSEGTVLSGEYIDVIHSKDFIKVNVEAAVQQVLLTNDKVAYTDKGFTMLETAIYNVLKAAHFQGMIADTPEGLPSFSISKMPRSETNPADRAARVYKGLAFSFELAGAVHKVEIKGEIII